VIAFTERFDHVAVAVHDAEKAGSLFRDILGGEWVGEMDVPEEGFRFIQYRYLNRMKIELLQPLGREGFLQKFLAGRGEGVHHLSYLVTDIESRIEVLRGHGIEPVHVVLDGRWKEAFIHPRQGHGVLVQLLEKT
jgi:methylmalonyl-CoA/ethylmalonyl-CoA epimerase